MDKAEKNKIIAAAVFKYAALSVLMLSLSLVQLYGIRPLGAGLVFAYIFLGIPSFFAVPVFIASGLIADFSLSSALYILTVSGVAVSAKIVISAFKSKQKYLMPSFTLASQTGLIFLSGEGSSTFLLVVSAFCTLGFMYAAMSGLRPVVVEKLKYKLLETELCAIGMILAFAASGLYTADFKYFPLSAFMAVFAVLLSAKLSGFGFAAFTALCFGVGFGLKSYDASYVAAFMFIAAAGAAFANAPRLLAALAALTAYIFYAFYFNTAYSQNVWFIIAAGVGGIVYAVLPKKAVAFLKRYAFDPHKETAVRYMLNKSRADTATSLNMSAEIFDSMAHALKSVPQDVKGYSGALKARVCSFCKNYAVCEKDGNFVKLDRMMASALPAGKITLSDIPDDISSSCTQLAKIVSAALDVGEQVKARAAKGELENSARGIVASQLKGMSAVLKDIAIKTARPLVYDREREQAVTEELNYSGVSCAQSLIAGDSAALIIRTECFDRAGIEKTVGRVMRSNYRITGIDDTILPGFSAIALTKSAPYDLVFGVAACAKEKKGESGDTHSFIKLDNSRFMIALCDGMGSGQNARILSETAISLVESFYRAGFDSTLVLNSVNSFLALNGGEGFSALDVCVVDLEKATADILKLGSPATYIKKKDAVARVDGNALPLGAVDEVSPALTKVDLSAGDMLVMASDGVADSFSGDKLSAAVLNLRTLNPQLLAESVLEETISVNSGKPRDDSTVIAARLIKKA